MDALLRDVPLLTPEAAIAGTRKAMGEYNRMGVTTVYEGHAMSRMEIGLYQMLRAEDALTVRVLTALESENYAMPWDQPLTNEQFVANLEHAKEMTSVGDTMLRHDGTTLSRGGPLSPGFLRMHELYKDPYGELTTGVTFVSEEKEKIALRWCAEHDLRLNYIGAGYRDHDEFLANAEALDREIPLRGRHWILQHNYLCTEEHARRYAALGFEITTSMSFSWAKGDLMEERIGRHVWKDLIPLRRLLDAGLLVACGSDWGPKNVFEHIELAETHEFCGSRRRNETPGHAVTREEALLMWTRDAARVLQWDDTGTLTPGNHADMIVVDRDPLTCEVESLRAARVLRTVLGGRTVYDAGAL
jgi:predicted amidohydrolase YtcJ